MGGYSLIGGKLSCLMLCFNNNNNNNNYNNNNNNKNKH